MNFKKKSFMDDLPDWLKLDVSLEKKTTKSEKQSNKFDFSLSGKFDATERWLLRGAAGVLILTLVYSSFSIYLNNRITNKISEAQEVSNYTDTQIASVQSDINIVKEKSNKYQEMKDNLTNINDRIKEDISFKFSIPNLLISVMDIIPEDVQITDIENTTTNNNRHIVIRAQSKYYDELGYFKAKLKEEGILKEVVSTQGEKQGEFVKIVIEGDLP